MSYVGLLRMWQRLNGVWLFKSEPFAGTAPDLAGCIAAAKERLDALGAEWIGIADIATQDRNGDRVRMEFRRRWNG